jgi:hypothetical protein
MKNTLSRPLFTAPRLALAALAAVCLSAASAWAASAQVLITTPVGSSAPADYAKTVASWKKSGAVSNAILLQQFDGPESPGFSSMTVLEFADDAAFESWKKSSASALAKNMVVSRVDVLTHDEVKGRDSSKAIFVLGQYEPLISPAEYKTYTDDYIVPNMSNQKFSGIMTRYTMYLEREASGSNSKPRSFLLTEYANDAEFARKKEVKDAYKVALKATHPKWTKINDIKSTLRVDIDETLFRPVALP